MVTFDARVLEGNLRALGARSATAAGAIRASSSLPVLSLSLAGDGGLTGAVETQGSVRRLGSAHTPVNEGERLAGSVDIVSKAATVVLGFGLGHHVAALARRVGRQGAIIVFEPDVGLLRAVLGATDCSAWLAGSNVVLLTSCEDTGAIAAGMQGIEAVLASGVGFLNHPPSRARLGPERERFLEAFAHVVKAVRTSVVTTLVQMDVTVRNLLQNSWRYAGGAGISDLEGVARGRPGIVVAAGPSLRKNIRLLLEPEVRERCVVVAVQTVLKQLLALGIRPDFVTALDYHEISGRFYEGLTAADVTGVTLVVEPKCNPSILEAWPGAVRFVGDGVMSQLLGPRLARPMGALPPGATVAHLAYYLARYLGCDPVVLIGQDLGFTDGHYYGAGAAIHNVWAGELNEFNTLEMLEWQRIARMRSLLRKAADVHGHAMYTDEQMATYLVQFERDFMADAARGLVTIDATEGGVRKQHTRVMTLREACSGFAAWEERPGFGALAEVRDVRSEVTERLAGLRDGCAAVEALSAQAEVVLKEMTHAGGDQRVMGVLIERLNEVGAGAVANPSYWLVQHINQTGQLNRFKADRAIQVEGLSGVERQAREIERDVRNVRWLADAAGHAVRLIDEALESVRSGRAKTREIAPERAGGRAKANVWASVLVDERVGGLGVERNMAEAFFSGMNPLECVLARLGGCRHLAGVLLVSEDVEEAKRLAGRLPGGMRVEWIATSGAGTEFRRRVARARGWARHCWRGGIANLSVYDEVLDARALAREMGPREIDAMVLLGADWALVDPSLIDAVVERYEERPEAHQLTFTQAAPGLAGCLVARGLVEEMARVGGVAATVGGLVGYQPAAPQSDPITKSSCVQVPVVVRDALVRCIPDTPVQRARLRSALRPLGERAMSAGAAEVVGAVAAAGLRASGVPEVLTVRLGRGYDRTAASMALRREIAEGDCPAVMFEGDGVDALELPGVTELAATAKAFGACAVGVRTRMAGKGLGSRRVLSIADVVCVDLLSESAEAYLAVTGEDGFSVARGELVACLERVRGGEGGSGPRAGGACGLPETWVVPVIERREAVRDEMEVFYARWIMGCGAAAIVARRDGMTDVDFQPLPLPAMARERLGWSRKVMSMGAEGWDLDAVVEASGWAVSGVDGSGA